MNHFRSRGDKYHYMTVQGKTNGEEMGEWHTKNESSKSNFMSFAHTLSNFLGKYNYLKMFHAPCKFISISFLLVLDDT